MTILTQFIGTIVIVWLLLWGINSAAAWVRKRNQPDQPTQGTSNDGKPTV